jgi:serine/threonine protein phosphatase PrpC
MSETFREQPESLENQVDTKDIIETNKEKLKALGAINSLPQLSIAPKINIELKEAWKNRDRIFLDRDTEILAVGDGTGDEGSDIAADIFLAEATKVNEKFKTAPYKREGVLDILKNGLIEADSKIKEYQKTDHKYRKMATTGVICHIQEQEDGSKILHVAESGDSPVAIINRIDGTIRFVNKGGSFSTIIRAAELLAGKPGSRIPENWSNLDIGELSVLAEPATEQLNNEMARYRTIAEAPKELQRVYSGQSTLMESLGSDATDTPTIHTYSIKLKPGDIVAAGTDGLFNNITLGEGEEILLSNKKQSPQKLLSDFTNKAIDNCDLAYKNPKVYTYKSIDDITGGMIETRFREGYIHIADTTDEEQHLPINSNEGHRDPTTPNPDLSPAEQADRQPAAPETSRSANPSR